MNIDFKETLKAYFLNEIIITILRLFVLHFSTFSKDIKLEYIYIYI